jgi:cytochrome c-type biogenesis protein CcmH/NrfG
MQSKEEQAEALHQEALALSDEGEIDAALQRYRKALPLDCSRPATHYNLRLIDKYRSEREETFRYKRAVELDPAYEASNWILAIAATALGNWQVVRSVWNRLGYSVEPGDPRAQAISASPRPVGDRHRISACVRSGIDVQAFYRKFHWPAWSCP